MSLNLKGKLPYSSAIRPRRRKGRTPDLGNNNNNKKKGGGNGGGGNGGKWGEKIEHLSVILVKAFQLWPYKYMAQVPRISNGINYKSDHRITSKTKSNQHVKACMGLYTEHLWQATILQ